jgi:hypothetical protein
MGSHFLKAYPINTPLFGRSGRRRKEMNVKHVVLNLEPQDKLRLATILVDEDKGDALLFLKECLKPQLDAATRDH